MADGFATDLDLDDSRARPGERERLPASAFLDAILEVVSFLAPIFLDFTPVADRLADGFETDLVLGFWAAPVDDPRARPGDRERLPASAFFDALEATFFRPAFDAAGVAAVFLDDPADTFFTWLVRPGFDAARVFVVLDRRDVRSDLDRARQELALDTDAARLVAVLIVDLAVFPGLTNTRFVVFAFVVFAVARLGLADDDLERPGDLAAAERPRAVDDGLFGVTEPVLHGKQYDDLVAEVLRGGAMLTNSLTQSQAYKMQIHLNYVNRDVFQT